MNPENVYEEEAPTEETTKPETIGTDASTISGSSSTSTVDDQKLHKLIFDELVATERQIKDLKAHNNELLVMNLDLLTRQFQWSLCNH